jgi:2-polyprenylphenol 6-hydroxylase
MELNRRRVTMNSSQYDIIILGSGLVGLTLANILAEQSFTVAIVDANTIEIDPVPLDGFHLRVSAINQACCNVFQNLNIWSTLLASKRVMPFEKMFVWDSLGKKEINFSCTDIARPNLGYIIENILLKNALLKQLQQYENVRLLAPVKPQTILPQKNTLTVRLADKRQLITSLLVGADGAHSWLREYARIGLYTWPYHHQGLVTNVATELPHQKTAWQCFLPEGPLALLPLPDPHLCSVVWSAPPEKVHQLQQLSDSEFDPTITQAFEHRLGKLVRVTKTIAFPLVMRHAKQYVKARIALVGDAAHTIHPLAGQGVNLGILDAASLAEVIIAARNKGSDWGRYSVLRAYERWRKGENWLMILGMEFFKRLFQSQSSFVVQMRNFGLQVADERAFIKNQFMLHAMGVKGELPEIAQQVIIDEISL